MEQEDSDVAQSAQSNPTPPEFLGQANLEALVAIQSQQLERLTELSRSWADRMQSEAEEAAAEDSKRVMAAIQELAATGRELLTKAWRA
jgi:hypothetical protein